MFSKKATSDNFAGEKLCAQALYRALADGLTTSKGIRVEDLITSAASIVGELCIEAAGDFNPRKHQFIPGSRVFSEKVNVLFSGNSAELDVMPADSVIGVLRDRLLAAGYTKDDFPSIKAVLEYFAANGGKESDWEKVPWSVLAGNLPSVLPLQVAYETRSAVDSAFKSLVGSQKLHAGVLTLCGVLIAVKNAIDRKIALVLALETVNGMAKTAPMTDEATAAARQKGAEARDFMARPGRRALSTRGKTRRGCVAC
jgi:hypothetical protein